QAFYHAKTLFLFTSTDMGSLVFPVAIVAGLSTQHIRPEKIIPAMIWLWLHLLQFCISNQSLNLVEDAENKPWRPLPSGRIQFKVARTLRWILLPLCLLLSWSEGIILQGVSLAAAFILHNELQLGELHWALRGCTNAWGYTSFNAGVIRILSPGVFAHAIRPVSFVFNFLIIVSTTHVQDFRDVVGDSILRRHTLPLAWPQASRIYLPLVIIAWSIGISAHCTLGALGGLSFCALAVFVGMRFYLLREIEEDRLSYLYYNVSL
ncbi:hypothetical protein K488DRAFT_19015, partial [Vararia minispora EC-137]